jgi:hypothetical protein
VFCSPTGNVHVSHTACVGCVAGFFRNASACEACPAGFTSIDFAENCSAVAVGFYTPRSGMYPPLPCPSGYFTPTTGMSYCMNCSAGYSAPPGAQACQIW